MSGHGRLRVLDRTVTPEAIGAQHGDQAEKVYRLLVDLEDADVRPPDVTSMTIREAQVFENTWAQFIALAPEGLDHLKAFPKAIEQLRKQAPSAPWISTADNLALQAVVQPAPAETLSTGDLITFMEETRIASPATLVERIGGLDRMVAGGLIEGDDNGWHLTAKGQKFLEKIREALPDLTIDLVEHLRMKASAAADGRLEPQRALTELEQGLGGARRHRSTYVDIAAAGFTDPLAWVDDEIRSNIRFARLREVVDTVLKGQSDANKRAYACIGIVRAAGRAVNESSLAWLASDLRLCRIIGLHPFVLPGIEDLLQIAANGDSAISELERQLASELEWLRSKP